jgi:hypothetical protein
MKRQFSLIMLAGLIGYAGLAGSAQGGEASCADTVVISDETKKLIEQTNTNNNEQDIADSEAVRTMLEKGREQADTIKIPENINAKGEQAAQETYNAYRSQKFQDKIKGYENWEDYVPGAKKAKEEQEIKGVLADSEKVYLFLSSSIPAASFRGYMANLEGVVEIKPVMVGIVGGLNKENKKERVKWWSNVLKKDTTCVKTPEKPCDLIKPAILVKSGLFHQYKITDVPALIYNKGNEVYQVQGDVGIITLLEKVNKEAKSPSLTALIGKIRGRI